MKAAIYVRVSKKDQDFERQIADLKGAAAMRGYEVVSIITEKVSGAANHRPGITELITLAESGKIKKVLVTEVSRLGRRTLETLKTLDRLTTSNVSVYIHTFGLETLTPEGKKNPMVSMMLTILAEFATMEREQMIERINSGLNQARRKGKKLGRKIGFIKSNDKVLEENKQVVRLIKEGQSIRNAAKISGVGNSTVMKVKKILDAKERSELASKYDPTGIIQPD